MQKITLNWHEFFISATHGVCRQIGAVQDEREEAHGADKEKSPWQFHCEGCGGEFALAKMLGVFYSGTVGIITAPDVGLLQVRTTPHANGHMPLHETDANNGIFVLVLSHDAPTYCFPGWCYGREGKLDNYWGDKWNTGRPAFWVPQNKLRSFESLQELIARNPYLLGGSADVERRITG